MTRPDKEEAISPLDPTNNPLIQSRFDVRDLELQKPIVFRASFNRFEPINLSQAWSLWVTGCRNDGLFGLNPAIGWLLTLSMISGLLLIALQQASRGLL